MFWTSDLASIELISGFMVPGAWVMASTSSSLADAGNARSVKSRLRRRRIIAAKIARLAPRCHRPQAAWRGRPAAVIGRPLLGRLEEGARLGEPLLVEVLALLGRLERVPPGGQRMELDAGDRQHLDALREDAVVEDHEAVGDLGLGLLQRLDEDQLAAAVGRQILDQQHALAR